GVPPSDPTVYICAQDRSDSGERRADAERIFIITNAPADGGRSLGTPEEREACETRMMGTLARCGLTLMIDGMVHTGPAEFGALFPGTQGAIYGMASHGWAASFRRPGTRSRIHGLYLAGGSVHPG
ncbi:MAG TPA: CrtD protein, partial [Hyphomicrobiaceae bacterium]|nr:CrtD protein [Hyphomicrobiaceae bacterium]